MKSLYKSIFVVRAYTGIAFIILCATCGVIAQAPSHTMKFNAGIDANVNGFWEYLPRNYTVDSSQRYPLLIFLHGNGDSGSTPDSATLSMVLNAGTPKIIKSGNFPDSFNVAGKWHKFVVISPQIKDGFNLNPGTIDALINYATTTYRIDNSRIYLCGLSMGGGIAWSFPGSSLTAAKKLAAIAVAAGSAVLDTAETDNIAEAFLPVLATHNLLDNVVPVTTTVGNVDKVKKSKKKVKEKKGPNVPAVDPEPLVFYWDTPGIDPGNIFNSHNVWSRTFEDINPGVTLGGNLRDLLGYNVYEWLLQYTRSAATPLPVIWEDFTITEVDRTAWLRWTTSREFNVKSFIIERSRDGFQWSAITNLAPSQSTGASKEYSFIDKDPFPDVTYYRIKELDLDEKAIYSVTKKFTNSRTSSIKLFPNPFDKQISFSFSNEGIHSTIICKLTDSRGAILRSERHTLQSGSTQILMRSLQSIKPGLFFITITDERGRILFNEKVIKK